MSNEKALVKLIEAMVEQKFEEIVRKKRLAMPTQRAEPKKQKGKSLGELVRAKREALGLSREQLAKKVKVTPVYIGHIERDAPVHFSERLETEIGKVLKLKLSPYSEDQNARAREYYRNRK